MHPGCGELLYCLICSHGRVHSSCCAVIVTSFGPLTKVGRLQVTVVIQSPLARKPTGLDVRARMRRSYRPCTDCRIKTLSIACEPEPVRKSSFKQVNISLICSGLVPQSQAITEASGFPETHLKGINTTPCIVTHTPPAPHGNYHHACVPWCLVMTLPHKVYVVPQHQPGEACPSYQTMLL